MKKLKKKIKKMLPVILGKRFYCKYIRKKHVYEFRCNYWEYVGKYRFKVHVNCCKTCGHCKKINV